MAKEKKEDELILSLRRSRKSFLVEYGCALFLVVFLLLLRSSGVALSRPIHLLVVGSALFSAGSAEFARQLLRYKITDSKITIIRGIIQQNKKNIYFHPLGFVPDLNTRQNRLQRILNIGTIFVAGGEDNTFEISDVSRPKQVMETIEGLIAQNRHGAAPPQDN
jgi:uncharacterized membrane protein YdbT with pleckstrin-like domain